LASLVVDRRLNPFPPDVEAFARKVMAYFMKRFVAGETP
jgi:hypothetical protein